MAEGVFYDGPGTGLSVPSYIQLPANYNTSDFASDLVSSFTDSIVSEEGRNDIKEAWNSLQETGNYWGSRKATAAYTKFFHRFSKSEARNEFLEANGGNPERAAESFLRYLQEEAGGEGEEGLNKALKGASGKGSGRLNRIPFAPFGKKGGGKGAGFGSGLVAKAYRLQPLIDRLKLQYKSFSKKSDKREELSYPDDVDIERLRSYNAGDLGRLTHSSLLLEDDSFYYKLSRKELTQTTYYRPIPNPRRFLMLIDVSGSMGENMGEFSRSEYAAASAICLLSEALKGANIATIAYFDDSVHNPIAGSPAEMVMKLLAEGAGGGGTSIDTAIEWANNVSPKPEEVIIITDGEDGVRSKSTIPVTTYFVGYNSNSGLAEASRNYYMVNG